jgi:hypothetical protein
VPVVEGRDRTDGGNGDREPTDESNLEVGTQLVTRTLPSDESSEEHSRVTFVLFYFMFHGF